MIEKHAMPDGTPIEIPGVVPKLSDTPGGTRWLGPALGAHTEEVLASIGIRGEAVEQLRRDGVI
jgi:formyl-CoA transferase